MSRFAVVQFTNPSGQTAYRVQGYKRNGERVRENFKTEAEAQCRQIELETEYLRGDSPTEIQATSLTAEQIKVAELAMLGLGDDWRKLPECVDVWRRTPVKTATGPAIDDAVGDNEKPGTYLHWLANSQLRDATKRHWKTRMKVFKNSVPNIRVSEMTPDFVEDFLSKLKVGPAGKITYQRAISRFCSWCIQRPRRWIAANPCSGVKIEKYELPPPAVLSLEDCKAILKAARKHKRGLLAPYVALGLFGGLRPFEISRMTWAAINLKDSEIRLESTMTKTGRKTGRGRIVSINPTLKRWLKKYEGKELFPKNWRKEFAAVKKAAGFRGVRFYEKRKQRNRVITKTVTKIETPGKEWPDDVLRHTAISHHFRLHQSYGKAAEQFGNSESVIKKFYQARVSSSDTKAFYALKP